MKADDVSVEDDGVYGVYLRSRAEEQYDDVNIIVVIVIIKTIINIVPAIPHYVPLMRAGCTGRESGFWFCNAPNGPRLIFGLSVRTVQLDWSAWMV